MSRRRLWFDASSVFLTAAIMLASLATGSVLGARRARVLARRFVETGRSRQQVVVPMVLALAAFVGATWSNFATTPRSIRAADAYVAARMDPKHLAAALVIMTTMHGLPLHRRAGPGCPSLRERFTALGLEPDDFLPPPDSPKPVPRAEPS